MSDLDKHKSKPITYTEFWNSNTENRNMETGESVQNIRSEAGEGACRIEGERGEKQNNVKCCIK